MFPTSGVCLYTKDPAGLAVGCPRPPENSAWCPRDPEEGGDYALFNLDCDGDGVKDWACTGMDWYYAVSLSMDGCVPKRQDGVRSACVPALNATADGHCPTVEGYTAWMDTDGNGASVGNMVTLQDNGLPFDSLQQLLDTAATSCTQDARCMAFNSAGYLQRTTGKLSKAYTRGVCLYTKDSVGLAGDEEALSLPSKSATFPESSSPPPWAPFASPVPTTPEGLQAGWPPTSTSAGGAPLPAVTPPGGDPSGQAPLPTLNGAASNNTTPTVSPNIYNTGAATAGEQHVPVAAIVGSAAGGAVLLAAILAAVLLFVRSRRRQMRGQEGGQGAKGGAADSLPDSSVAVLVRSSLPPIEPPCEGLTDDDSLRLAPATQSASNDASRALASAPATPLAAASVNNADRGGHTHVSRGPSSSGARLPASGSRGLLANVPLRRLFHSVSGTNVVVPHASEVAQQQQHGQEQQLQAGGSSAGIAVSLPSPRQSAPGQLAPDATQPSGSGGAGRVGDANNDGSCLAGRVGDANNDGSPSDHHNRTEMPPLAVAASGTPGAHEPAAGVSRARGSTSAHDDEPQAAGTSGLNRVPPLLPSGIQQWNFHINPDELSLGRELGRGGFGDVYRAMWRGTPVAVKLVSLTLLSQEELDRCKEEVKLMFRLHHPNIVQLLGAAVMPSGHLAIVMELVLRGSLFALLHGSTSSTTSPDKESLDMRRRLRMAGDTAKGILYLHAMEPPMVHRDIKSMNLLVTADWGIKVCDFGLSRPKNATYLSNQSPAGTPAWMAPEALLGHKCNEKSDVYSFGMVLYELFTGQLPWSNSGQNIFQLAHQVGHMALRPDLPAEGLHPQLAELIQSCWAQDAVKRPSISEALDVLRGIDVRGLAQSVVVVSKAAPVCESRIGSGAAAAWPVSAVEMPLPSW